MEYSFLNGTLDRADPIQGKWSLAVPLSRVPIQKKQVLAEHLSRDPIKGT